MAGIPKLVISRQGIDNKTGGIVDMSLDTSRAKLQKFVKCIKSTTGGDIPHGLAYAPRYIGIRKFSNPNRVWMIGLGKGTVDATNINIALTATGGEDLYAHVMLDPVGTPEGVQAHLKVPYPRLMIGESVSGADYERLVDTVYDTLKIMKTGTLSIHKYAVTHAIGDPNTRTETDQYGNVYILEETTVSYEHNLGYCPLFAPFVDGSFIYEEYKGWNDQWYKGKFWGTGEEIVLNEVRWITENGNDYTCIKSHTSSSVNRPNTGANWEDYWEITLTNYPVWVTGTGYVIGDKVSEMVAFGDLTYWNNAICLQNHTSGVSSEPFVGANWQTYWEQHIEFPATITVILNDMEDIKVVYGGVEIFNYTLIEYYSTETELILKLTRATLNWEGEDNISFSAIDLSVNYTIFYNRADEEFNLLS